MLLMEDYPITYLVIFQGTKSISQESKNSAGVFALYFTRIIPESVKNRLVTADKLIPSADYESRVPHTPFNPFGRLLIVALRSSTLH